MIDTHCHLDSDKYSETRKDIITESFEAGVEAILIPGTDADSLKQIEDIVSYDERLFFAAGIHPHNANEYDDVTVNEINRLILNSKCKAIGEIGLDYYYDFNPRNLQIEVLEKQIEKAKLHNLPVIIHNREADDDILYVLKNQNAADNAVMHCFSSSKEYAKAALDMGLMFSFTGNITFKKSTLSDVIEYLPLDRIMLETDGPYMTPEPYRGKTNHPKYLSWTATKISEIKNIKIEEVINMTNNNARKFFQILLTALLLFIANSSMSLATEPTEYVIYEDSLRFDKPLIGIGAVLGTNTIVEAYDKGNGNTEEVSYDGIFTPGAKITVAPLHWLLVNASYLFTKNQKIADENINMRPTLHHIWGLGTTFIFNHGSRINFGINTGVNFINISGGTTLEDVKKTTDIAIMTGLTLIGNLEIADAGLLNIGLCLDFHFITNKREGFLKGETVLRDVKTFYSIPKLELVFYPNFLKF